MNRAVRRGQRSIARAERAIEGALDRLARDAEALRARARARVAALLERAAERRALTGPSAAERRDGRRAEDAIEDEARAFAVAAVVRLRGLEDAVAELEALRERLHGELADLESAAAYLAREEALAGWGRRGKHAAQHGPVADFAARVDAVVARAAACVATATKVAERADRGVRRRADRRALERDGEPPELEVPGREG